MHLFLDDTAPSPRRRQVFLDAGSASRVRRLGGRSVGRIAPRLVLAARRAQPSRAGEYKDGPRDERIAIKSPHLHSGEAARYGKFGGRTVRRRRPGEMPLACEDLEGRDVESATSQHEPIFFNDPTLS